MSGVFLGEAVLAGRGWMVAEKTGGLVFCIKIKQTVVVCARCFVALCQGGGLERADKGRADVCVWHEER